MHLTKTAVDRLPAPVRNYALHWDDKLPGFGVRVTASGVKSFVLQRRIQRRLKRITIGRYGDLTLEQARKRAQKLAGDIAVGENPIEKREHAKLAAVTLRQAFSDYLAARKDLKPRTVSDMQAALKALENWKSRPLTNISRDMVLKRHAELGKRSHARANLTMRYLRIIFNFAAGTPKPEAHMSFPMPPARRQSGRSKKLLGDRGSVRHSILSTRFAAHIRDRRRLARYSRLRCKGAAKSQRHLRRDGWIYRD